MDSSATTVQELFNEVITEIEAHRFGTAGLRFLDALEITDTWPDGPDRSKILGFAASLCKRAGLPDLSLMAVLRVLESRDRGSDPAKHCGDLISLANLWNDLGRTGAAAAANEAALAIALDHRQFANAASASTNLAIIDVYEGRFPQSLERLQASLKYLANDDSNPGTDAITRLTLLKAVDAVQADPAIALDASADLFTRLERYVGPERWKLAAPAFHRLVDRYIASHPDLDAEAWKRKTFPHVFGRGRI